MIEISVQLQVFQTGTRVGLIVECQCPDLMVAREFCDTLRIAAEAKEMELMTGLPVDLSPISEMWEMLEHEIQSKEFARSAALRVHKLSDQRGTKGGIEELET